MDRKPPARIRQGLRAGGAPGAAWPLARDLHAQGETDAAIAEAIGVSEEAVRKRRHSEGWTPPPDEPDPLRPLATTAATDLIPEDSLLLVLTALAAGVTPALAARAAGLDHTQLTHEATQHTQLARALSIAGARGLSEKITRINAAGERGDWKADAYLLERHPDTKDDFAPKPTGSAQGGVTIIIGFDRDTVPTPGITIEGTAEEV